MQQQMQMQMQQQQQQQQQMQRMQVSSSSGGGDSSSKLTGLELKEQAVQGAIARQQADLEAKAASFGSEAASLGRLREEMKQASANDRKERMELVMRMKRAEEMMQSVDSKVRFSSGRQY